MENSPFEEVFPIENRAYENDDLWRSDVLFISTVKIIAPQVSVCRWQMRRCISVLYHSPVFFPYPFLTPWFVIYRILAFAGSLPSSLTVTLGYLEHQTHGSVVGPWTVWTPWSELCYQEAALPPTLEKKGGRHGFFGGVPREFQISNGVCSVLCVVTPWSWQPATNISCGVTLRPSEKEAQMPGIFLRGIVGVCPVIGISTWTFGKFIEMWLQRSWDNLTFHGQSLWQNKEPNMSQTTDSIEGLTRWGELLEKWGTGCGLVWHFGGWYSQNGSKWFKMHFLCIGFTSSRNNHIVFLILFRTFFVFLGWICSWGKCFKTLSRRWLDIVQLPIKALSCWKDWGSWDIPIATWQPTIEEPLKFVLPLLAPKKLETKFSSEEVNKKVRTYIDIQWYANIDRYLRGIK